MDATTTGGRISEKAFKTTIGLLFSLAMIAATARTVVRLKTYRRLFVDDIFLLFACICLTVTTILTYNMISDLYTPYVQWELMPPEVLGPRVTRYQRTVFANLAISWTVIFAVKFAFLCFFRALVDRIKNWTTYWKVVLGVTTVSFCFVVNEGIAACPWVGTESLRCGVGGGLTRAVSVTAVAISLDLLTDIMMVAIPIRLLWRVQIKSKQKLGLGFFLCLSVFMIVIALVRISALVTEIPIMPGVTIRSIDPTWKFFWQQIEACVAVFMVSFTAFRSFFVTETSRYPRASPAKPGSSTRRRIWNGNKRSSEGDDEKEKGRLPPIPSATITGLRTYIRGGADETKAARDEEEQWESTTSTANGSFWV